jgi:hypothetical protein
MKFAEIDLFGVYVASVLAITEALAQYAVFLTGRA